MFTRHRDDQADQAHDQERAHAGQVALGRVAVKRQRAEGRGRDEERLAIEPSYRPGRSTTAKGPSAPAKTQNAV
jgi:hypothetical protein